jgi:flagellar basal-body rod protein FlgF
MNIGIYQSAASMSALERWQDTVTQNISSSQMPGYRKRTTAFMATEAGQIQTASGSGQSADGGQGTLFPKAANAVNFLPGESQATGRDLDVAIQGEGFFEIQGADGQKEYTRDGEFQVRPDNTLTTTNGQEVLSSSGSPIQLLPSGGPPLISADGNITQGATVVAKLGVQKFADNSALIPGPSGTYLPSAGQAPTPIERPELLQGYLEGSNVSPMHEMVDLITISRAYESNQKMITTEDQEMQKTLDALG